MTVIFMMRTQDFPLQFLISRLYFCSSHATSALRCLISSMLGTYKNNAKKENDQQANKSTGVDCHESPVKLIGCIV